MTQEQTDTGKKGYWEVTRTTLRDKDYSPARVETFESPIYFKKIFQGTPKTLSKNPFFRVVFVEVQS